MKGEFKKWSDFSYLRVWDTDEAISCHQFRRRCEEDCRRRRCPCALAGVVVDCARKCALGVLVDFMNSKSCGIRKYTSRVKLM
jgi:hypothetical protein